VRVTPLVGLVLIPDTGTVRAATVAYAGSGPDPSLSPVVPEGDHNDNRKEQANGDEETRHR